MKKRTTLYAEEGKILTNGEHFGRVVHLEIGADAEAWREITVEEYEEFLSTNSEEIEA